MEHILFFNENGVRLTAITYGVHYTEDNKGEETERYKQMVNATYVYTVEDREEYDKIVNDNYIYKDGKVIEPPVQNTNTVNHEINTINTDIRDHKEELDVLKNAFLTALINDDTDAIKDIKGQYQELSNSDDSGVDEDSEETDKDSTEETSEDNKEDVEEPKEDDTNVEN